MAIRSIDDHFHVVGQLSPDQIKQVADLGYKTLICMRPDKEGFMQPSFDKIAAAANAAGIRAFHIPVVPGRMSFEEARKLKDLLAEEQGPVLAFCASGQRCAAAYEMAKLA